MLATSPRIAWTKVIFWVWIIAIVITVSLLTACGGSSNSSAGPTPIPTPTPAPVFTSTAPVDASEDTPYTYQISATDPSGGAVTFRLQTAPENAALNDNVLTWTPTHEQSRLPNSFVVVATGSHGTTATQSFTVTPTGTIHGTAVNRHLIEGGSIDTPEDPAYAVRAVVPDGDGYTILAGERHDDGSYLVRNVPAGHYWLNPRYTPAVPPAATSFGDWVWTSASDIDTGTTSIGRPDVTLAQQGITETFDPKMFASVFGTTTWYVPNVHIFRSTTVPPPPAPPAPTPPPPFDGTRTGALIQASKGDKAYLLFAPVSSSSPYTRVVDRMSGPILLEETDGGTVNISGAPSPLVPNASVHPIIRLSEFDAFWGTQSASSGRYFNVEDVIYDGPPPEDDRLLVIGFMGSQVPDPIPVGLALVTRNLLFVSATLPQGAEGDLGEIAFSNPLAQHTSLATFSDYRWKTLVTAENAVYGMPYGCKWNSRSLPDASHPISPQVGPVQAGSIDGLDFFADHSDVSLTPTFSWSAPALGTPTSYSVLVMALPSGSGYVNPVFRALTADTQFQMPPDILVPGTPYYVVLESIYKPDTDFELAPFRPADERHSCSVVSGIFTTAGTPPASPGIFEGMQRIEPYVNPH